MKENRLFKIVYFILEKEHVTASELAEKFEVSVRTIYRDTKSCFAFLKKWLTVFMMSLKMMN